MAGNKTTTRLRVRVDPIRCTAFGFCAEFCPEMFTLDDWGYAWLRQPEASIAAKSLIRETARLCPTGAILVEEIEVEVPDTKPSSNRARSGRTTKQAVRGA